ncbi:DUF2218 domain-containing protein [Phenylobacterium sp.]|uniref:DUF2218 domain-containing protein n=1 Tax=Phenylobacterium sp. TaxID=1871053 RepID=UPI0035B45B8F
MGEAPVRSVAEVATAHAARYLVQLCKHFAHRIPASHAEGVGRIEFPIGVCDLAADGDGLRITVTPAAADELEALKDVVVRHLVRFAFREELVFDWRRA